MERFFLFLLALAGLAVVFVTWPAQSISPAEKIFHIEASQYAYNPGEITVNPGDIITINLVSTDVVHGLYIDGYGLSVIADPGQSASLTFVANKIGSFRLRCNVTCGAMHPFMIGKLNVGSNQWLYRSIGLAFIGVLFALVLSRKPNKPIPDA